MLVGKNVSYPISYFILQHLIEDGFNFLWFHKLCSKKGKIYAEQVLISLICHKYLFCHISPLPYFSLDNNMI